MFFTMQIYGILSASRKEKHASDDLMDQGLALSLILGLPQLFHYANKSTYLLIGKYVEDLLLAGKDEK